MTKYVQYSTGTTRYEQILLIPAQYYSNTIDTCFIHTRSYVSIRGHTWSYQSHTWSYLLSTGHTTPSHTGSYPIVPVSYLVMPVLVSSLTNTCLIPGYTEPHLLHTWSYLLHTCLTPGHTCSYVSIIWLCSL